MYGVLLSMIVGHAESCWFLHPEGKRDLSTVAVVYWSYSYRQCLSIEKWNYVTVCPLLCFPWLAQTPIWKNTRILPSNPLTESAVQASGRWETNTLPNWPPDTTLEPVSAKYARWGAAVLLNLSHTGSVKNMTRVVHYMYADNANYSQEPAEVFNFFLCLKLRWNLFKLFLGHWL